MTTSRGNLIIIGASARAAAQSAIRAGYQPWCIDLFADRDLQAIAPVKRCPREQWPQGILELMKEAPPGPVLFTGAMENHIEVVRSILSDRSCISSDAEAMERSRVMSVINSATAMLWTYEFVEGDSPECFLHGPNTAKRWEYAPWHARWTWPVTDQILGRQRLIKRHKRSGGTGIRVWTRRSDVGADEYVEQLVNGTSISLVSGWDGRRQTCAIISEQLVGDSAFGASGFTYVGNISPIRCSRSVIMQMCKTAETIASRCNLRGLFGIDGIATNSGNRHSSVDSCDGVTILEVNPRYVASVEVHERAGGFALLAEPQEPMAHLCPDAPVCGKAIVYAKALVSVPDLYEGFRPDEIADVPGIGERIERGHPICTVFAEGSTRDACYAGLRAMADQVYTRLEAV